MKPVAIDLCCGLGGWAEGLIAEGYEVIGYDTEAHDYGTGGYPGKLILQDITTLHGSQFKRAALIVASPPCQAYSYMAMPWSLGKAKAAAIEADESGAARRELNLLFDTCFRLQREASEAAGHHIPMIVENVRGAQKWVGRAQWNYGSFYLWGDVPALMPISFAAQKFNPDGTNHPTGSWFAIADSKNRGSKVPGFRFDGSGKSFQTASVMAMDPAGIKQGGDWFGANCESSMSRMYGSKSPKRKMASAMIAKIPFPLSQHIARTFFPQGQQWGQLPHPSNETPAMTQCLYASSVATASTI